MNLAVLYAEAMNDHDSSCFLEAARAFMAHPGMRRPRSPRCQDAQLVLFDQARPSHIIGDRDESKDATVGLRSLCNLGFVHRRGAHLGLSPERHQLDGQLEGVRAGRINGWLPEVLEGLERALSRERSCRSVTSLPVSLGFRGSSRPSRCSRWSPMRPFTFGAFGITDAVSIRSTKHCCRRTRDRGR